MIYRPQEPVGQTNGIYESKETNGSWFSLWNTLSLSFYFTDQGSPIDQNLQLLYDNFNHEALHGEVIEEGDIVKVIQSTPDGKAKVELWIDLSKGSNPVRIETTENSDALTNRNVVSWEWTQINNVWVPKKLTSVEGLRR